MAFNVAAAKAAMQKQFWSPPVGDSAIRLLPRDLEYFTQEEVNACAFMFLIHYNVGPSMSATVVCPKTANKDARCPICEEAARLKATGIAADKERSGKLYARKRYLLNIIDFTSEASMKLGVQAAEIGVKIYNGLLQNMIAERGDPLDTKTGSNFRINKTVPPGGDEGRAQYTVVFLNQTNIEQFLFAIPDWRNKIKDLSSHVPAIKSFEEIKAICEGTLDIPASSQSGMPYAPTMPQSPTQPVQSSVQPVYPQSPTQPVQSSVQPVYSQSSVQPVYPQSPTQAVQQIPSAQISTRDGNACFGVLFTTKSTECANCQKKDPCKKKFLEG